MDYAQKRPSEAVQPVTDIARLRTAIEKGRERVLKLQAEIEGDQALALDPEARERLLLTLLVKVKDNDEEAAFLREKVRCADQEHLLTRRMDVNDTSGKHCVRDLKEMGRRIERMARLTSLRKPQEVIVLQ